MEEYSCLALVFEGLRQSYGLQVRSDYRDTFFWPTKSAVGGILCAALGFDRMSREEEEFLEGFRTWRMTNVRKQDPVRLTEYQTVHNIRRLKDRKATQDLVTHRTYIYDATFYVFLTGETAKIKEAERALRDPVCTLSLGRKNCIPTRPILAGFFASEEEALQILDDDIENFDRMLETDFDDPHAQILRDVPCTYAIQSDRMTKRAVLILPKKGCDA